MVEENAAGGGRRRDSRLRADLAAHFETLAGKHLLSICDLSQSGARLRPHLAIRPRAEGVLSWLGFEAFGMVVRSDGDFIGIEFEDILPPSVLMETRRQIDCGIALNEQQWRERRAREWIDGQR